MVQDTTASLEQIISIGFKRILTSGKAASAMAGLSEISKLVRLANDRIIIMPGSGINVNNLKQILDHSKCREFHCSASKLIQSRMIYRNQQVAMGSNDSEFQWKVSDAKAIKRMILIANNE